MVCGKRSAIRYAYHHHPKCSKAIILSMQLFALNMGRWNLHIDFNLIARQQQIWSCWTIHLQRFYRFGEIQDTKSSLGTWWIRSQPSVEQNLSSSEIQQLNCSQEELHHHPTTLTWYVPSSHCTAPSPSSSLHRLSHLWDSDRVHVVLLVTGWWWEPDRSHHMRIVHACNTEIFSGDPSIALSSCYLAVVMSVFGR